MLTQTTELAIKVLILLALKEQGRPYAPRVLAGWIGCSPTYLSKILGQLSKAGLLRSIRGARGGVMLAGPAEKITLLAIVEACQGLLVGNYCRAIGDEDGPVCAFHEAMLKVHRAMVGVLKHWTLSELAACPAPTGHLAGNAQCRMRTEGVDLSALAAAGKVK